MSTVAVLSVTHTSTKTRVTPDMTFQFMQGYIMDNNVAKFTAIECPIHLDKKLHYKRE